MSDKQLRQDILDELDFEPSINAANIGVAVENGIVTLTGHVSSYAAKVVAERAARRIKGVRAIAQEIEVRFPFDKKTADDEVAKRASDILRWNTLLPNDLIQIAVHNGWVTLSGQVEWQYQKTMAEDDVRKLSGVAGILNNLSIKPRVQAADVKQKIESALKRSAEVEAQGIRVTVRDGGKITIEGRVHNWDECEAIKNAAWSAPGVQSVENLLTMI